MEKKMNSKQPTQQQIENKKQKELITAPVFLLISGFILALIIFPEGINSFGASIILALFSLPIGASVLSKSFPSKFKFYYLASFTIGIVPLLSFFLQ